MSAELKQAIVRAVTEQAKNTLGSSPIASIVDRGSWGNEGLGQLEQALKAEAQKLN